MTRSVLPCCPPTPAPVRNILINQFFYYMGVALVNCDLIIKVLEMMEFMKLSVDSERV